MQSFPKLETNHKRKEKIKKKRKLSTNGKKFPLEYIKIKNFWLTDR